MSTQQILEELKTIKDELKLLKNSLKEVESNLLKELGSVKETNKTLESRM